MTPFDIPADTAALIFDCDGTLADTMPMHYRAWVDTLKEFGGELPEEQFYAWAGVPAREIIHRLIKLHGHDWVVEEVRKRKQDHVLKRIHEVKAIEPVVETARRYAGRLPMAVATGGTRKVSSEVLRLLGIDGLFAALVTADDVEHGKPAPDIFLESARRLGVPPEKCVVFEDGDPGIEAALAAGMQVIDVRPVVGTAEPKAG